MARHTPPEATEPASMATSSPVLPLTLVAILTLLILRGALAYSDCLARAMLERDEDRYLVDNFCDMVDHRGLGRHVTTCTDALHRLSLGVTARAMRAFVDDIAAHALHPNNALPLVSAVTVTFAMAFVGALHTRYLRDSGQTMPVYHIKRD